ncbi:dihydroorotate dehydrogenase electron transfer subunit [bacterium]|nr:dihydroorotate dehydrogenase electron transfer subunit [bacterium]
MHFERCTVTANEEYGPGHWVISLRSEQELSGIRAGEFLNLQCDPEDNWSLLRPLSILGVDLAANTLLVYYKHLGRLSRALSSVSPGESLNVLFPLGGRFPVDPAHRRIALIGGGVGLAPLLFLAQQLEGSGVEIDAYFGGASQPDLVLRMLEPYNCNMLLSTDDGSHGYGGNCVDCYFDSGRSHDVIYTCGPNPMMNALRARLDGSVPCWASLEEYMACGVGACLGCATHIDNGGQRANETVCRKGPVFDLSKVVFHH